jgi:hypothetical protein
MEPVDIFNLVADQTDEVAAYKELRGDPTATGREKYHLGGYNYEKRFQSADKIDLVNYDYENSVSRLGAQVKDDHKGAVVNALGLSRVCWHCFAEYTNDRGARKEELLSVNVSPQGGYIDITKHLDSMVQLRNINNFGHDKFAVKALLCRTCYGFLFTIGQYPIWRVSSDGSPVIMEDGKMRNFMGVDYFCHFHNIDKAEYRKRFRPGTKIPDSIDPEDRTMMFSSGEETREGGESGYSIGSQQKKKVKVYIMLDSSEENGLAEIMESGESEGSSSL